MIGKVLTRLFALFGMTLTCVACYGVVEAEYNPEWSASGRVVDTEGEPIKGVEVSMSGQKDYTDADGHFYVKGDYPSSVTFTDVDGVENGGEFQTHKIDLIVDGEYVGSELGDVVLKRRGE